jgi:hypothetical protein
VGADHGRRREPPLTVRPLGIGIASWLVLGILAFVDVKYNHAAALHGLGDLAKSILPSVSAGK